MIYTSIIAGLLRISTGNAKKEGALQPAEANQPRPLAAMADPQNP
jgi:hypothetical protein